MPKANIHPEWYSEAKVYCNGEVVMTVGSTQHTNYILLMIFLLRILISQ